MVNEHAPCLLVVCKSEIILALAPQCPEDSFTYDNITFRDQGFGDFTGFYDWLRNSDGEIIGVRYLPVDGLEFLGHALVHLPYVEVNEQIRSIEFYFTDDRGVDESVSDDQDFGSNRLFKSQDGVFAISFNPSDEVISKKRVFHLYEN
jgi:hypothetical protein